MSLRVSGKHIDIGEAFRTHIDERIQEAVGKYFDGGFSGQAVISKDGPMITADCKLHLDTGAIFQANGRAHEPYAAFADAADRIEKRIRRYKRKLKDHKSHGEGRKEFAYTVVEPIPEEPDELPEDFAPAIIAETTLSIGTHTVAGAVMELDRQDGPVVLFKNAQSGALNIVFRRADGHYGWVDPSTYPAKA